MEITHTCGHKGEWNIEKFMEYFSDPERLECYKKFIAEKMCSTCYLENKGIELN